MNQKMKTAPAAENKMGTMPIGKLLFNMSLPMMISMLVQAMYNVVDSYFVAKISTDALTAISLAYPIQMLMIAVAIGTSVGMNSYMSRKLGEGNTEAANKGASNGLCLLLLSAIVFAIFGFVITPFFRLFTDDPQLIEMGVDYLEICMVFGLGVFIQIGCERILQSMGKTGISMVTQLVGAEDADKPLAQEFSLEKKVDAATPPTLLFHCDDDKVVPAVNSALFYQKLKEHGIKATLHIYPSGGHGWGMNSRFRYYDDWQKATLDWLSTL